jgi:SPFH domain / Band 7 family
MEFMRQRRFWTGLGIFLLVVGAVAAYAVPPWPAFMNWVFDLLAFLGSLVAGLMLISQFVLPVQTMRERRAVFDHFMQYVSGNYGPIIFVKDGRIVGRKEELRRYGPGVALVDPVSAIVIERAAARHWWAPAADPDEVTDETPQPARAGPALVRAAGPGIDFIAPGERIVAALDLRRQSRGAAAKALTRDGIECSAFISVTFGLDPDPERRAEAAASRPAAQAERNQPAYHFNRGSGFRAVYGVALGEKQAVDWTELPLIVAVERFRDALSEYRLDELFQPTKPDVYPFSTFQGRVVSLVKEAPVLRERGLVVYGVGIGSFSMPREVLNQRIRSWQARWQKATIQQEAAVESQSLRTESRWQIDAQTMIFKDIQALLGATDDPVARKALALMLMKSLRRAAADPRRRQRLPEETLRTIESLGEPAP